MANPKAAIKAELEAKYKRKYEEKLKEAKKEFGIDVYSVVTMNDIIQAIEDGVIEGKEHLAKMYEYRSQYGAN